MSDPERGEGALMLFGGGRMGSAMLRGWIEGGMDPARVAVTEPAPSPELAELAARTGLALNPPPAPAETIVLAVKPQQAGELAATLAALAMPGTLLVSIMAGRTVADLRRLCPPAQAIVRAMPNLPAAIGRGATVAFAHGCDERRRAHADRLLGSVGTVEWLADEALIDAATGLSGSGPGYIFYLADCLTQAGIAAGLAPGIAERLARATIAGAGAMLAASDAPAAALRRDVTSPGGTTAAGLAVLMADGTLEDLVTRTVAAAAARARELAG